MKKFILSLRVSFLRHFLILALLVLGISDSRGANFYRSTTTPANFNAGNAWNATTSCGAGALSWPTTSADIVYIQCASKVLNTTGSAMACGDFNISNGTFNLSSGTLTVWGNLNISGSGILNLNGGTLVLYGNFNKTGGTFTHSSGTFNFGGTTTTQTITSNTNPLQFYDLTISGNQNRTMNQNVQINNKLTLTGGTLSVGSFTLTVGTSSAGTGITQTSGKITLTTSSNLSFGGSYNCTNFGALFTNTFPLTINNFTMTRNLCIIALNTSQNLTVSGAFTLTAGSFAIGSNTLTLNGAITGNINGSITGGPNSDLTVGGTGSAQMYFDLSNFNPGGTNTIRNFTNTRTSTPFTLMSSLRVSGILSQPSASSSIQIANSASLRTLSIEGDLTGSGKFYGYTSGLAYIEVLGSGPLTSPITMVTNLNLTSLTINRSGNPTISLGSDLGISSSVVMTAGSLDLKGFDINLGTTGRLFGESATNRILCSTCSSVNDGRINATNRTLAASTVYSDANTTNWDLIGRIGVFISTGTTAPGSTTISRGFYSRSGGGLQSSINRFFEITPTTNSSLNATLQLNYYTTELNSITETDLGMYRDGGTDQWILQTPSTLNTASDFISKSGIAKFSTWTAGSTACGTPLNGPYTIGGTTPDYANFTAAVNALIQCGISGPVTFDVRIASSPYTERISIPAISGASVANTITFNGNGSTLQYTGAINDRATITLDDADYFTFDNLVIEADGASYGWCVHFTNDADYNTISNCTLNILITNSGSNMIPIVASGSPTSSITDGSASYNVITGNTINGGYTAIEFTGTATSQYCVQNEFTNNTFLDFYTEGIMLVDNNGALISGNNFSRPNRTTFSTFTGVALTSGCKNTVIEKNKFHNNSDGNLTSSSAFYAIDFSSTSAPVSEENIVKNNLIYNVNGNGQVYALYNSSSNGAYYFHNTISLDETTSTASNLTRGMNFTTSSTNTQFKNNILTITRGGTGTKHALYYSSNNPVQSDNNVIYINATNGNYGLWNGSTFATFANWQTANSSTLDQNSIEDNPLYEDAGNADFTPTEPLVNNIGADLFTGGVVTDDYLGTARTATPDPGAFEFNPSSVFAEFSASATNVCSGSTVTFTDLSTGGATGWTWAVTPNGSGSYTFVGATNASSQNPQIQFNGSGTFTISLTATDGVSNDIETKTAYIKLSLSGTYTIGGTIPDYATFTAAVSDLNTYGVCGPVIFNVRNGTYTEAITINSITGSSATNTVTFRPETAAAVTLTSSGTASTLILDGADNIIFEGRMNGSGTPHSFTLNNTQGTVGSTVEFSNEATNNKLQYCAIQGGARSINRGVIEIRGTSSGTTGNDNITIDNNLLGNSSALAGMLIYSNGSVSATNSNNSITNNEIFNFGNGSSTANTYGIRVTGTGNGGSWTITGNSFYHSSATSPSGTELAIDFEPGSSANSNTISNNYIGGKAALCGGSAWTSANYLAAITVDAGTDNSNPTIISNNIVQNISTSGDISGVNVLGGSTQITNNLIGHTSIPNSVTTNGGNAGYDATIFAIRVASDSPTLIDNDTVQNVTATSSSNSFYGILSFGNGGVNTITNNKVLDCTGAGTYTASEVYGIRVDIDNISGNLVENNEIRVGNTSNAAVITDVIALEIAGSSSGGTISKNKITKIYQRQPGVLVGIEMKGSGSYTVSNNIIHTTNNTYTNATYIYGIRDAITSGTLNYFYNSILISGGATGNSFAYLRYSSAAATVNLTNNIFIDASSGSGSHYAIHNDPTGAAATGWNSDYNFLATADAAELTNWDGTAYNITDWKTNSGDDNNSTFATVTTGSSSTSLINPSELFVNATNGDLKIGSNATAFAFISDIGTLVSVTVDIDNAVRSGSTPDMGADEFSGSCVAGTWTAGATTNDWFTLGNWSCNTLPTSTIDVTIPNKATTSNISPQVAGPSLAATKNLTIQSGGVLDVTVLNSTTLTVHGNFSNSGTVDLGNGKIIFKGGTISGTNIFGSLDIDNGSSVTLTSATSVKNVLSIQSSSTLNTGGLLTLLSNASLMHGTNTPVGSGAVSGNITMKRTGTSNSGAYNFWSSPVQNASVSVLGGTKYYYEPANATDLTVQGLRAGWVFANGTMTPGVGYISTGSGAVSFTGVANNYPDASPLTRQVKIASNNSNPWNLVGNPFPSALSVADFWTENAGAAKISGVVYLWDDDNSGGGGWATNDYVTYSGAGQVGPNSSTAFNGFIASGQSFFVEKLGTSGSTYNVNFKNSMRSTSNSAFFRQAPIERLWINVVSQNNQYNETLIAFIDDATDGRDIMYDAKRFNGAEASIYTKLNGEGYSIQAFPLLVDERVVELQMDVLTSGTHTLNLKTIENLDETIVVLLEDRKLGVFQNLLVDPSYVFTESAGLKISRFFLHFNPALEITSEEESCSGNDGQITLNQKGTKTWDFILIDAQGTNIQSEVGYSGITSIDGLVQGTYTLSLTDDYGYQTVKTVSVGARQKVIADFDAAAVNVLGDPIVFNNLSSGATSYEWDFGDGTPIEFAQNPSHVFSDPGDYEVTMYAANDDCSDAAIRTVSVRFGLATGVNQMDIEEVFIFGNGGKIWVKLDLKSSNEAEVFIYDILGKELVRQKVSSGTFSFNGTLQNNGSYLVKVITNDNFYSAKVLLSR